jgi:hypothetical protein
MTSAVSAASGTTATGLRGGPPLVILLLALLVDCLGPPLVGAPAAEDPSGENSSNAPRSDSALKLGGVFTANLPTTESRNSLRFTFHPHFGDLTKYDHIRLPVGLRYGVTSRWELVGEVTGYMSHGLRGTGIGTELGFSEVHLGTKYNLGKGPLPGWDTGIGIDYFGPLSSPPPDLTDGLEHVMPYITFSRHLGDLPNVRVFWSVGGDIVSRSDAGGNPRENQLTDSAVTGSAGFVWDLGSLRATFQTDFGTTRAFGESSSDAITFRPGLLWELPARWSPTSGRWLIGTGLRATLGPDGSTSALSVKVRVDSNLKQWWRRHFDGREGG